MATNNDFLQRLRLRNLLQANPEVTKFGGQNFRAFDVPQVSLPQSPLNAPDTGLASLRNKRSPFLDQYRELLMKAPNRADYQQGKIGKALALAAGSIEGGLSKSPSRGIVAGRDILDRPYNRALEDYSSKGGRYGELANLEYRDLGDSLKLETAISAEDIKRRDQIIKEVKTISDINLNGARAAELENRMKTQGKSIQRNEVTGNLEVIDIASGARQPLGQFLQTPEGKANLAFKFFQKEEGVRQGNRKELQTSAQAHDVRMEGLKLKNDEYLARFKKQIENRDVSATQDNAAFEGAYKEFLVNNPEMKATLFTTDPKSGELILKVDPKTGSVKNPQAYEMFTRGVNDLKQKKLGGASTGFVGDVPSSSGSNVPTVQTPQASVPQVQDPVEMQIRQYALEGIKTQFPNNPELLTNEAAIADAIAQIKEAIGSQTQDPFANMPDAYPPMYPQPSRTQRELNDRGVSGNRFR